jgi:hypothetical protein
MECSLSQITCIIFLLFLLTTCLANAISPSKLSNIEPHYRKRYDYGPQRGSIIKLRAEETPFVITGVLGGSTNGSVPSRPEIRDLEQNRDAWTLYILGLDMMQGVDQNDLTSWYQIAGIF